MSVTIVIPTFNEAGNIRPLVSELEEALYGVDASVLFVDDSSDDTSDVIREVSQGDLDLNVSLIQRESPTGGLSGAVAAGITAATGDIVVVCDADLQHPPHMVRTLINEMDSDSAPDLAVASRYTSGRKVEAFSLARRAVSTASNRLARSVFPRRLRGRTDLMSGFFAFRRDAVDVGRLRPNGFKILLEILGTHDIQVSEVPFTFGKRLSGSSNATAAQGVAFLKQLFHLRFPDKRVAFAVVGAAGIVPNVLVMALLEAVGINYVLAACLAVQAGVVFNFAGAEYLVWHDSRAGALWARWVKFWTVGNLDLLRVPLVVLLASALPGVSHVVDTLITFVGFFILRYALTHGVVYRRTQPA